MIKNILSAGIVALTFGLVLGGSNLALPRKSIAKLTQAKSVLCL